MSLPDDKIRAIEADLVIIKSEAILIVRSAEENQNAAVFLGKVKARYKRLEELRKEFTAPMNESIKKINARFKMFTEPLEELEEKVKNAMADYMREEERKTQAEFQLQQEKLRKREEEIARKEAETQKLLDEAKNKKARLEAQAQMAELEFARKELVPVVVEAPKQTVRTESGTVTAKKVWTFKVVNLASIPRQWLVLDEKAVRKAIANGAREINGLEIYQDIDISSRQI